MTPNKIYELAALKERAKRLTHRIKSGYLDGMRLAETKIDAEWTQKAIHRLRGPKWLTP